MLPTAGEYAGKHPDIAELLMQWGVQAEIVLGQAARAERSPDAPAANADYLKQKLKSVSLHLAPWLMTMLMHRHGMLALALRIIADYVYVELHLVQVSQ